MTTGRVPSDKQTRKQHPEAFAQILRQYDDGDGDGDGSVADDAGPKKEPFLNQLADVILIHNWYRSTSTCFHVYSREYTCSTGCCHEF